MIISKHAKLKVLLHVFEFIINLPWKFNINFPLYPFKLYIPLEYQYFNGVYWYFPSFLYVFPVIKFFIEKLLKCIGKYRKFIIHPLAHSSPMKLSDSE